VSLIANGTPVFTSARLVAGYPVKTPMLDIHVIGAGGGSIASIDDAGALTVGPRSAGASPGPVAYGRGGTEPTITDANLCLGRLDPIALLGGRMQVDLEAARRAVSDRIATPLGLSLEAAAHGILRIAIANMSRAIRSVSVEKGYDVGSFALCAFGGAGPLHAADVAIECGIPQVFVPREPGTLCARGMLLTDLSFDFVRSHFSNATHDNWVAILTLFETMEEEGGVALDREAIPPSRRSFRRVLDARYRGQNFEVKVDCDGLASHELDRVVDRFHEAHVKEYGYAIYHRPVEFVSARVKAVGAVDKAPQTRITGGASLGNAAIGERPFYVDRERGWRRATVYRREDLPVGVPIPGPAVATEMSSTTVILPDQTGFVDPWGNLIVRIPG
jgi:N-methylhydantoinase A